MRPARTSARALVVSFAAVAATFTLATAIAQVASLEIRSAAQGITANSSPTISSLSSMRSTMRQLEIDVYEFIDNCEVRRCGEIPRRIEALRHVLMADWEAYQKIPAFPGERDTWPLIDRDLRVLDADLTRVFEALARADSREAEELFFKSLKPMFDRLDEAVSHIIQSDHADGLALASKIEVLAHRSVILSVILDVLSIALTAVAAALAIRLVRRHELSLSRRAEELDKFAGRVAHDVLGPLWTTTAALHVAQRGVDDRQRKNALELGQRSVELVQQLVKGLLEFARSGAQPIPDASADLRAVVSAVVDNLRPTAEHSAVELQVGPSVTGDVACSRGVLTSVIENLVENAIKHMGESQVRRVLVRAGSAEVQGAMRIEIEDTGPGISAPLRGHLFEPFVRGSTKGPPGFGLGLATVKRIVTGHKGRLGFMSAPGGGTVFWVELPQASSIAAPERST